MKKTTRTPRAPRNTTAASGSSSRAKGRGQSTASPMPSAPPSGYPQHWATREGYSQPSQGTNPTYGRVPHGQQYPPSGYSYPLPAAAATPHTYLPSPTTSGVHYPVPSQQQYQQHPQYQQYQHYQQPQSQQRVQYPPATPQRHPPSTSGTPGSTSYGTTNQYTAAPYPTPANGQTQPQQHAVITPRQSSYSNISPPSSSPYATHNVTHSSANIPIAHHSQPQPTISQPVYPRLSWGTSSGLPPAAAPVQISASYSNDQPNRGYANGQTSPQQQQQPYNYPTAAIGRSTGYSQYQPPPPIPLHQQEQHYNQQAHQPATPIVAKGPSPAYQQQSNPSPHWSNRAPTVNSAAANHFGAYEYPNGNGIGTTLNGNGTPLHHSSTSQSQSNSPVPISIAQQQQHAHGESGYPAPLPGHVRPESSASVHSASHSPHPLSISHHVRSGSAASTSMSPSPANSDANPLHTLAQQAHALIAANNNAPVTGIPVHSPYPASSTMQ